MSPEQLKSIIEAALHAAGEPVSVDRLLTLFTEEEIPSREQVREALATLREECDGRGVELVEVGSGFRFQVRRDLSRWVQRLWEEKPVRYSRALLETLALIAYRQPITRAEIEDIRGVSVSTNIMRSLQEREWVRVVGHRDVPGKPAMYATTRQFLDYFGLKGLGDLPPLAELRDIDKINEELDLEIPGESQARGGEAMVSGPADAPAADAPAGETESTEGEAGEVETSLAEDRDAEAERAETDAAVSEER
jgi:segregation and condensation protein B